MKILIVDDHPIVRAGLRRLLASEPGAEFCEAVEGKSALAVYREQRPTLVILDLNLPGLSGLAVIPRLRAADPTARVLIFTMHDDPLHVSRALRAGALGYVSKNAAPDEILRAVRRVAAGHTYVEHEVAQQFVFPDIRAVHPLRDLSLRDLEILRLLAQGNTLSQIADTIGIAYKTTANRCSQIKAKLGAAGIADLIRLAIRCGLVDRDTDLSSYPRC